MTVFAVSLVVEMLLVLTRAQNESVDYFWATRFVTETVWALCSEIAITTVIARPSPSPEADARTHYRLQIFEQGPFSTSLVLDDAVLTGITVQPASSPTSCYALPIPTSALQLIGFSTTPASANASDDSDPVFFYIGNNATVPEYIVTFIDGNRYLLDVSSDASAGNRIALMLPGGESMVIDETGMHHFAAGCGSGSSAVVDGFLNQIMPIVQNSGAKRRKRATLVEPGMSETNFTVMVQVQDVIGTQFQGPQVSFGPSPCANVGRNDTEGWSTSSWSCQHPGANSDEKVCERNVQNWLRPDDDDPNPLPGGDGWPAAGGKKSSTLLLKFISKAGLSVTSLFPALDPPFAKGLRWLNTAESAVLDVAEYGGESVCRVLHMKDEYFLVLSDPGISSVHTIGAYISPPVSIISDTLASWTTRMTKVPPRVVIPGATGFESVTATAFLP